jgi:asparagine synthase (glutamine-hydrolysing)
MCGIAGILGRIDERNRAALGRMSAAMVHRGPDDEGSWESPPGPDGRGALLTFRGSPSSTCPRRAISRWWTR